MLNESVVKIYENRCRLCLDDNAVDVFLMKNKDKMLELLSFASGIAVKDLSLFPRKICEQCCVFALKLHSYRRCAVENDRLLKTLFNEAETEEFLEKCFEIKDGAVAHDSSIDNEKKIQETELAVPTDNRNAESFKDVLPSQVSLEAVRVEEVSLPPPTNKCIKNSAKRSIAGQSKNKTTQRQDGVLEGKSNVEKIISLKRSRHQENDLKWSNKHKRRLRHVKVHRNFVPQKAELVDTDLLSMTERKYIFTSSLELIPTAATFRKMTSQMNLTYSRLLDSRENSDDLLFPSGKTDPILVCDKCQMTFDSKRALNSHMQKHLKCRFCKYKARTWEEHTAHLRTTCYLTLMKNLPHIYLSRIEESSEMVNKYPVLLKLLETNTASAHLETNFIDLNENRLITPVAEKEKTPKVAVNKSEILHTFSFTNPNENVCKNAETAVAVKTRLPTLPEGTSQNPLQQEADTDVTLTVNGTSSRDILGLHHKTRFLQTLFEKYNNQKMETGTDSFVPSSADIVLSSATTITYENLYNHLRYCKIPVYFQNGDIVCSRYVASKSNSLNSNPLDGCNLNSKLVASKEKQCHNYVNNGGSSRRDIQSSVVVKRHT